MSHIVMKSEELLLKIEKAKKIYFEMRADMIQSAVVDERERLANKIKWPWTKPKPHLSDEELAEKIGRGNVYHPIYYARCSYADELILLSKLKRMAMNATEVTLSKHDCWVLTRFFD